MKEKVTHIYQNFLQKETPPQMYKYNYSTEAEVFHRYFNLLHYCIFSLSSVFCNKKSYTTILMRRNILEKEKKAIIIITCFITLLYYFITCFVLA